MMAKKSAGRAVRENDPYDKEKIDFTRFKPDIAEKDWKAVLTPVRLAGVTSAYFLPIETLTPAKTVGLGRTNLTIIMPTIVQTDAATPYAGFDRQTTPSRNPTISMHFEPGAYGVGASATFLMAFAIDVAGQSTFTLGG